MNDVLTTEQFEMPIISSKMNAKGQLVREEERVNGCLLILVKSGVFRISWVESHLAIHGTQGGRSPSTH